MIRPRRSVLLRYMLSFLAVLIIPLGIVCAIFIHNINTMLIERDRSDKADQLSELSAVVNKQLTNLSECAYRLSSSNNISRYKMNAHQQFGMEIINELFNNLISSEFVRDIFIYSPEIAYAYSAYSSYTPERFVYKLTENEMTIPQYHKFLNELEYRAPTLVYQEKQILIYYNFPALSLKTNTYLIFQLDYAFIDTFLQFYAPRDALLFGILNGESRLIGSTGKITKGRASQIYQTIQPNIDNVQHKKEPLYQKYVDEQSRYELFVQKQPEWDWRLYSIYQEDDLVKTVQGYGYTMYFIVVVVLLFGGLLAFFLTYLNYAPIKKLKQNTERLFENKKRTSVPLQENELDAIGNLLNQVHTSYEMLEQVNGMSYDAVKHFLFIRLVQGAIPAYGEAKPRLEQIGVYLDNDYFLAVNVFVSKKDVERLYAAGDPLAFLERFSSEERRLYAVTGLEQNQIILLISADEDDVQSYLSFLEQLHLDFAQDFCPCVFSVGLVSPERNGFSISYNQSMTAYEYRSGENQVILFSPSQYKIGISMKYQNMLLFLSKAIVAYNAEEVTSIANYTIQMLQKDQINLHNAKFLCHNFLETVLSALYQIKIDSVQYSLNSLLALESIEDGVLLLQNLTQEVCQSISRQQTLKAQEERIDDDKDVLLKAIMEYIQKNLGSHQLSIAGMSDDFKLSSSYVSRIFKEQSGKTVLEYINEQRIQLAQKLLSTTDDTLETIVAQVGYLDASSFIRKFKKIVGITPGEYRRLHKE